MSNTYTSAQLRSLLALVEQREKLQAAVSELDAKIDSAYAGRRPSPVTVKAAVAPARKPARGGKDLAKRGALKEAVLQELAAAGSTGLSVKALSDKLRVKNQNLHVWFSTTGKSIAGLKRIGVGLWRYSGK